MIHYTAAGQEKSLEIMSQEKKFDYKLVITGWGSALGTADGIS